MSIQKVFLAILLITNLSGCAGYWVSGDHTGEVVEISKDKGMPYFGVNSAIANHPVNGSQKYNEETKWCGLTIWAIIPIPLWLPVCHSYTEMTFANNEPIKRTEHYVQGSGLLCGPFVLISTEMDGGTSSFCSTKFH